MAKALAKVAGHAHVSLKMHRHMRKQGHVNISLKDIQKSLSGIGVSLSTRVVEDREKR